MLCTDFYLPNSVAIILHSPGGLNRATIIPLNLRKTPGIGLIYLIVGRGSLDFAEPAETVSDAIAERPRCIQNHRHAVNHFFLFKVFFLIFSNPIQ